jgi:hypothetical protein
VPEDGGVRHAAIRRGRGVGSNVLADGGGEEPLRLGDLASQGIGRFSLVLPHEGGSPHTSLPLRGRGTCGGEGSGERRSVTAGVDLGKERWRGREGLGTGSREGAGVQPGAGKVDVGLLDSRLGTISSRELGLRVTIGPVSSTRVLNRRGGENLGRCGRPRGGCRRRDGLAQLWLWVGQRCGRERKGAAGTGTCALQASTLQARSRERRHGGRGGREGGAREQRHGGRGGREEAQGGSSSLGGRIGEEEGGRRSWGWWTGGKEGERGAREAPHQWCGLSWKATAGQASGGCSPDGRRAGGRSPSREHLRPGRRRAGGEVGVEGGRRWRTAIHGGKRRRRRPRGRRRPGQAGAAGREEKERPRL